MSNVLTNLCERNSDECGDATENEKYQQESPALEFPMTTARFVFRQLAYRLPLVGFAVAAVRGSVFILGVIGQVLFVVWHAVSSHAAR